MKQQSVHAATPNRVVDVEVAGGALRVAVWGEPKGASTVVLAVHGLTMSHRTWSAVAERLSNIVLIAPDLRGRGASSELPGPYGFAQHVEDLEAVIRHFGLQRIVAVGHAMGGYVVEQLAARRPALVAELVLVDGGLTPSAPEGVELDAFIKKFLGPSLERMAVTYHSRQDYRDFWRDHPAFAGPPAYWNAAIESFVDYDVIESNGKWRSRTAEAAVRQDFTEGRFDSNTRTVAFGLTKVPITLLQAERGLLNQRPGLIPDELLEEYREYLPQLEDTFLPGTNHYTITLAEPGLNAVVESISRAERRSTI
ncbi:alpha/beta hydrolase [Rhodococcus sp. T2V]|uniref:alpha/beta hydrolase n=1 Tax=Rhodococcus sp. T2V TaxID=3034164 RepID=UPI0023E0F904|nr:alpha/beta hydrolase [Rhodococcus sp. T2V]MDF3313171.1 alpha/beta hydrolase [Rhodococcus sp. T2V]